MSLRRHLLLLASLLCLPTAALAQSAESSGVTATASVRVVRPLQLTALRNLDFGTIVLGQLTTSQTVSVTGSGRTCGSGAQLTCTGTFATAQFRVIGTNNQQVLISAPRAVVTLTNGAGQQLTLTPAMPRSVTLPNSGNQGVTFDVGGSLAIGPTTADGLYAGTIEIQVAYQ